LLVGSPCMNTGVGPTVDVDIPTPSFNGNARSGATTDMGAYLYVDPSAPPVADFTATPLSGEAPKSIAFTDATTGVPTTWDWDFGDGSTHGTTKNPTHIYTVAGTYTVTLIATNGLGTDTEIKTDYLTISPHQITYYVDASGGSPGGYTSLYTLSQAVVFLSGDTIEVVDNGVIVETSATVIPSGVTLRSWPSNTSMPTIRNSGSIYNPNHIIHPTGSGVVIKGILFSADFFSITDAAIWCSGSLTGLTIDSCKFDQDCGIIIYNVSGIVIKNCLFFRASGYPAIYIDNVTNVKILNNTFYNTVVNNYEIYLFQGTIDSCKIVNNIFYVSNAGTSTAVRRNTATLTNFMLDYNDAHGFDTPYYGVTPGANSILYDPVLNPSLDGSLLDGSSCIGTGIGPSADADIPTPAFNGVARAGTTTDIGAYNALPFPPAPPAADFLVHPRSGYTPLSTVFQDISAGTPTSWDWDFGDGSPHESVKYPTHVYSVGRFTVTLTVTNGLGTDTEVKTTYVSAYPQIVKLFDSTSLPPGTIVIDKNRYVIIDDPTTGMYAYSWNGSTLSLITSYLTPSTGPSTYQRSIFYNGTYLFRIVGTALKAYTFNGVSFAEVGSIVMSGTGSVTFWTMDLSGTQIYMHRTGPNPFGTSYLYTFDGTFIYRGAFTNSPYNMYEYYVPHQGAGSGGYWWLSDMGYMGLAFSLNNVPAGVQMVGGGGGTKFFMKHGVLFETNGWLGHLVPAGVTMGYNGMWLDYDGTYAYVPYGTGQVGIFDITTNPWTVVNDAVYTGTSITYLAGGDGLIFINGTSGASNYLSVWGIPVKGTPISWDWNFGDGSTHDTTQNPSHIYTGAGTYTVSLAADYGSGPITDTKPDYITVTGSVTADFTGTPTSGPANLSVAFIDTSAGTPTAWDWDFGDGSTHATTQNPTHIYTVVGTYTVILIATNGAGSDTEIKTDYIEVGLLVDFSATPVKGRSPLFVRFSDLTIGNPTTWAWNFGDGETSSLKNPVHLYNSAGVYTVSLTASNFSVSGTRTRVNYITATFYRVSTEDIAPPADRVDLRTMYGEGAGTYRYPKKGVQISTVQGTATESGFTRPNGPTLILG